MKYFACSTCQKQVFFSHSQCKHCHTRLGYIASDQSMACFQPVTEQRWLLLSKQQPSIDYKPCYNYQNYQICNWMLAADSEEIYCEACQLSHIIPDLNQPEHILYWERLEHAKQRFLYLMQQLQLMPRAKVDDHDRYGLRFNFLMPMNKQSVMTGHANGIITLNASEADVIYRETTRVKMGENYRTVLGHFRHESGHYYLDLMQYFHPELMSEFRQLFGDERQDYAAALKRHYEFGAPDNWQEHFVSSYASTHPWEDWAESWAHYLHMMDTLETAFYAGLCVHSQHADLANLHMTDNPIGSENFETVLHQWTTVTFNLNALNRSMGLEDAYPFILSAPVLEKLRFIHRQVLAHAFHPSTHTAVDAS